MLARPLQHDTSQAFLSVETIETVAGFAALRDEWNRLLESSDSNCLYLTWEWLYTWWKHLAGNRKLSVIAIRNSRKLEALAPLCRMPFDLSRGRPFSALEFLGSGHVGSDYLDVIVRRGADPESVRLLALACAERGIAFEWTQLRQGKATSEQVATRLKTSGWSVRTAETNVCPYIPLAGLSFEDYLTSLGREHRYSFHRKLRRLQRDFTVRFEQASTETECHWAMEELFRLHQLRWSGRGGSDAFHTDSLLAFHREWSVCALRQGWLRIYSLRLNDVPAAFLYGFLYNGIFYFYQSGFDPEFSKYGVGMVTTGLAIRGAIEEGAEEFDFLHGNEEYKAHWARVTRPIGRIEMYPPRIQGRLAEISVDAARSAKRLIPKLRRRNCV